MSGSAVTRAAVVREPGAEFSIEHVELDNIRADEVLVRMLATGICQSDIGAARGHFPFPMPAVLGHEGVGVIEEVGASVTRAKAGDHVLLNYAQCGHCRWCLSGHPAYCERHVELNLIGGRRPDGSATIRRDGVDLGAYFFGQSSFAERAIVNESSLVVMPADIDEADLATYAPLVCGIQTGVGAIVNVLQPDPGDILAVAGAGGVGLAAIMATRLRRAGRVIAIDRVASRLELALELGADDVIDTSKTDLGEQLASMTGGRGVDIAVDATGHVPTLERLIDGLAIGGRCGVIGVPPLGSKAAFDVMPFIMGKSIHGIAAGDTEPHRFLPILIDAVRRGQLPIDRIEQRYAFEQINQAAADAASGVTIKPILIF